MSSVLFWDVTQRKEAVPYRHIGPIFKGQYIQVDLTIVDGTDRLSCNVIKELPL